MTRTAARAAVTAAVAAAGALVAAPPAAATGVPIPMHIYVYAWGSYFQVCGAGRAASTVNVWHLQVAGARDNGTVIQNGLTTFQATIPANFCVNVPKSGAANGAFVATLTYTGAGVDVVGAFPGNGRWAPGQPDETGDSGIGLADLTIP